MDFTVKTLLLRKHGHPAAGLSTPWEAILRVADEGQQWQRQTGPSGQTRQRPYGTSRGRLRAETHPLDARGAERRYHSQARRMASRTGISGR